ncbi:MAG: DUF1236 domain-containing protein [Rubellimicrobium sp.]|nr:DUF1236 domain-containing protein [Rubellimicrobium sp.]
MRKTVTFAILAGLSMATTVGAQTDATASTDLNLREGPGPMYAVIAVIPADGMVGVEGCLDAASWCRVTHEGVEGWASGDYLTAMVEEAPAPIYLHREAINVATLTYEDTTDGSIAAGGAAGILMGALIAGPVGAAVGAIVGGSAGALADPGPQVTGYVLSNPVETIYLDGEVVVGAGIPDGVTLLQVPETEYTYAYINGVPVIVEPTARRVIHIAR